MTIIDNEVNEETLAAIDPVFDDDHYICCRVQDGFNGVTTAFCGELVLLDGSDIGYTESVGCDACMAMDSGSYCPLNKKCLNVCERGNRA